MIEELKKELHCKPIKYKDWDCVLNVSHYIENSRIAISLADAEDGSPVADATVNIPDAQIAENQICVPEYKCEGMMEALEQAGIAYDDGKTEPVRTGFVICPVLTLGKRPEK